MTLTIKTPLSWTGTTEKTHTVSSGVRRIIFQAESGDIRLLNASGSGDIYTIFEKDKFVVADAGLAGRQFIFSGDSGDKLSILEESGLDS